MARCRAGMWRRLRHQWALPIQLMAKLLIEVRPRLCVLAATGVSTTGTSHQRVPAWRRPMHCWTRWVDESTVRKSLAALACRKHPMKAECVVATGYACVCTRSCARLRRSQRSCRLPAASACCGALRSCSSTHATCTGQLPVSAWGWLVDAGRGVGLRSCRAFVGQHAAQAVLMLMLLAPNRFSKARLVHRNVPPAGPNASVYAFAAAQVKKAMEVTKKLNGQGYVFWGGARRRGLTVQHWHAAGDMRHEACCPARIAAMPVWCATVITQPTNRRACPAPHGRPGGLQHPAQHRRGAGAGAVRTCKFELVADSRIPGQLLHQLAVASSSVVYQLLPEALMTSAVECACMRRQT